MNKLKQIKVIVIIILQVVLANITSTKALALACQEGIEGTVTDSRTGEPVVDAVVTIYRDGTAGGITPHTRADGSFQYFTGDNPDSSFTYTAKIVHSRYFPLVDVRILSCFNNPFRMDPSLEPTLEPGEHPRCNMPAPYAEFCEDATDGCTSWDGDICVPPGVDSDPDTVPISIAPYDLCAYAGDNDSACRSCLQVDGSGSPLTGTQNAGIWTAVGCIPSTPLDLASALLAFAISIGGGIALLIMLFGLFMIATAGGNPEKVQAGQQLITSAVTGLLVIIFSAIMLNFIGVKIFSIPGL